jgi:hypothetical protein
MPGAGSQKQETHQAGAVGLIGPGQPRDPIGKWLKEHPRADVAHRVRRQNGTMLIATCGRNMLQSDAVLPRHGARLCEVCLNGEA